MKVIDLLNKIANGEEVPNEIKIRGIVFKFTEINTRNLTFADNGSNINYAYENDYENYWLDCARVNEEIEMIHSIEEDKNIEEIEKEMSKLQSEIDLLSNEIGSYHNKIHSMRDRTNYMKETLKDLQKLVNTLRKGYNKDGENN